MLDSYYRYDTIAALATPPGEGGVAIIRISGAEAIVVGGRVFSGPVANYPSHTAHYGRVLDSFGRSVDTALLLVMQGPRSYTGETTVEIQCHGGSLIARKILEIVINAGARLAKPGEFTYRAFMNGRLDLAQAEGVQALIAAKSERALNAAHEQLQGRLSARIQGFQGRLVEIAAILEAWVDFPEEGLAFASFPELKESLGSILEDMRALLATFHQGRMVREGVSICLAGCPNVGKSSLMNALLDHERAIVTPIPGTTRDLIEEPLVWGGMHFRLIDTAGIRASEDVVEQEGVKRSQAAIQAADVVLLVLDATRPLSQEDCMLLQTVSKERTVVVWNKMDAVVERPVQLPFSPIVEISAQQRRGLGELQLAVEQVVLGNSLSLHEEVMLTQGRHKEAVERALDACEEVYRGLSVEMSPEFLCIDIREGLNALATIMGQDVTEDILSAIFSRFCLGK